VCDLEALVASTAGKVEIESVDENRDGAVVERLVKGAVLAVFKELCPVEHLRDLVASFDEGTVVHVGDDVPATAYVDIASRMPALRAAVERLGVGESPAAVASGVELILEGLHLSKRLNKDAVGARATYRSRA
jgi:magnesium chelatase subunit I